MEEEYGEVEKEMEDLSTKLVQNDVEKLNTRTQGIKQYYTLLAS